MEAQLVSFGNFLFKKYDVNVFSNDGKNIPIEQRMVTDADLSNWKFENTELLLRLPSQHQIGDKVKVFLMSEDAHTFPGLTGVILATHFYQGKVKYDIELEFAGDFKSRVYNVDSILVEKFK